MQPVAQRALIIGLMGPAIQALGFFWTALHFLLIHWSGTFGPRHLIYEPGILLIVVGFALSVICVPVALEVVKATEQDVEIPVYQPEPEGGSDSGSRVPRLERGRLARYSAGKTRPATGPDQQTQARG